MKNKKLNIVKSQIVIKPKILFKYVGLQKFILTLAFLNFVFNEDILVVKFTIVK
jgi:hypothetical protein